MNSANLRNVHKILSKDKQTNGCVENSLRFAGASRL